MQNTLVDMGRAGAAQAVEMGYATVTGRADKWFFLGNSALPVERAVCAASCLVEPDLGDTVLVCHGGPRASYILAVLARATPAQATINLPGGVALQTDQGQLQIQAEQLDLHARQKVSVVGPQVQLQGVHAHVHFQHMDASASQVQARWGVVSTLAQSMTTTVGRLVQKARDSFRWTENLEDTRAGRVRMQVTERFHLKSKHTTMLAQEQVKIDGKKIDLG